MSEVVKVNTKKIAAEAAVEYIKDGMTVGLGTGSTAYWAIQALGARVKKGLQIRGIATSKQSETMALELGIEMTDFATVKTLDITIDGADEVDDQMSLIKGGGGALLREKIVASATSHYIIVADETKLVSPLGKFPLPVEIVLFGWELTVSQLEALGCTVSIRQAEGKQFITDNGNYIADCSFGAIPDPAKLSAALNALPGVVENGLFVGNAELVIIGMPDGTVREFTR